MISREDYIQIINRLPDPKTYHLDIVKIPFIKAPGLTIQNEVVPLANSSSHLEFTFRRSIDGTYWTPESKEFDKFQDEIMEIFNR